MSGLRPCPTPKCSALTKGGHCFKHRRALDLRRGSFRDRGYDSRWDRRSKAYLRSHPLCVVCEREGRVTPAYATDHIVPHKGNQELFWDEENNWQAICAGCHARKTATEGGFGRDVQVSQ